ISANGDNIGIYLTSCSTWTIQGNKIGTNAAGDAYIGQQRAGVLLSSTTDVTIGGTTTSMRNLITANYDNSPDNAAIDLGAGDHILVQGNYVGLNASGT